ncbi:SusC/RagA family TonB-linked outer membrane protein [Parafilimonas terrae]|uniref:TonB-linked outer membrane protein, SusC/RagA family n=1 Tax=Parafilimonas terrae TaxID=1465490 RepID=A0A1I5RL26_9BACT|nr:TonB-dependent receptor [Parafilimonas terrae]SFP59090.1 TonB-linked outer membrane protein, SusC/RagA family [Parafilimonas terrae]
MKKIPQIRAGLITCLLFCFYMATGQTKTVTGHVTDSAQNGLPNVTVKVKNQSGGTTTDASGNFSITVPSSNAVLVFNYVGMKAQEVTVGDQSSITVTLLPDNENSTLNEVVVIGYGTVKKSDLTGAVATVKGDRLMDRPVPNVTQALQGKVAGVDVSVNSNAPGAGAKVRVRGIGSINSNIDPLYVVDGVIGVDPNSINPNDVASLEVLKDASSTAIFGARGANGVIIITTKRGRKGGTTVSYDGNVNMVDLYRHLKTLNSDEFVQVYNLAYANGSKWDPDGAVQTPPKALNHENFPLLFDANDKPLYNTNWEKETYKPAFSQSHQLNFQGGGEKSIYSLSLGYLDQNGLMVESWFKRYSARFTLDNDINNWLKVGGNINIIKSRQRMVSDANGALNVPRMVTEEVPIVPVKYPDGTWAGNNDIAGLEGGPNPVNIATNRYSLNNNMQMLGDVYLLFHITKDLDFKTDYGYNVNSQKNNFYSSQDLAHLSQDQGGVANINAYNTTYWQSENYLTYNKTFNNNHKLTALLGMSFQQFNNERVRSETQNFIDDIFQYHYQQAGSVRSSNESQDYQWSMNSYFARATYDISGKYFFTATGRYDGSSKFGKNNKYAFFPSVGAAWRLSEEDFMKNNTSISNLKLRASYGVSGNQEIGQYLSIAQIQPSSTVLNGASQSTLLPSYIGNPDLKWEKSVQFDAGLELGLFSNRINLDLDFYTRDTKDLLLQQPTPWSAGFVNAYVYRNVGSVRNTGLEVNLTTENIRGKNFTWTTNFIFATNRNKVLKLNDGNADIFPGPNFLGQNFVIRVGEPIGSFYGMTRLGTYSDKEADEAAKHGLKVGDRKYIYNEDGSNYYSIIGQAYPKWTGTFSSSMSYKNWDFAFDIRFVQGVNTAANFKHSSEDRQTIANSLATVLDAWTPDNQNTMVSQVRNYKYAQDSHFDTWWVEDGSFIRGQNFVLGYTVPTSQTAKAKIQKLRFYASVQNLFIITKYTGYDPEVDTFNSGYGANGSFSQNLDFFAYPRPRTWNLGVSLVF